jgi:hypothetical protein
VDRGGDGIAPVAREELAEAAHAELATGDLGAQIAERGFGEAQIVLDDLPERVVALPRVVDLERAELQPLLVDLGGLDRAEADPHAADVDPMGAARGERDHLVGVEAGRIDHDVVEMLPAHAAMIHDDDVAGRKTREPVARDAVLHRDAEVGEEDRQAASVLRDHAAVGVDQPAAEVAHLVDHHVVGGLAQRRRHLVGIGVDGVAHDLDGDGVGFHVRSASVTMICPLGSITARSPGPIRVVELASSITAGPAISAPAAKPGRHRMRVSSGRSGSSNTTGRRCSEAASVGVQGCDSQRAMTSSMRATVTVSRRLTTSIDWSGAAWP